MRFQVLVFLLLCFSPSIKGQSNNSSFADSIYLNVNNPKLSNDQKLSKFVSYIVLSSDTVEIEFLLELLKENKALKESILYVCWKDYFKYKENPSDSVEAELKLLFDCSYCLEDLNRNHENGLANLLIGLVFNAQGRAENAAKFFDKANQLLLKTSQKEKAYLFSNWAISLAELQQLDSALNLLKTANNFYKNKPHLSNNFLANLTNQSIIAEWKGDYKLAAKNYKIAIEKYKDLGNLLNQVANINNLGGNFLDRKNLDSANYYLSMAETMAEEHHFSQLQSNVYRNKYLLNQLKGDYKNSLEYLEVHQYLEDSIKGSSSVAKMAAMQKEFELQLKAEKEKREQDRLQQITEEKEARNRNIQYLSIISFISAIFILLYFSLKWSFLSNYATTVSFLGSILLFEFVFVVLDPWVESISNNQPYIKLTINFIIALCIVPVHNYIDKVVKGSNTN